MQTTITKNMAFGFDGEHANGQPFRADTFIASAEVTFGTPAMADGVNESGFRKAKPSTGTNFIGMFVGPHQHIKMELPSDTRSIKVPAGTDVAVASKGCWFVTLTWDATPGDFVQVTSGAFAKYTNGTKVGEIVDVDDTKKRAILRLI